MVARRQGMQGDGGGLLAPTARRGRPQHTLQVQLAESAWDKRRAVCDPGAAKGVLLYLRDHGLQAASDATVLQHARNHDQVLISADTDFGTLHAMTGADRPSVILIRRSSARRASELATLLLNNLDAIADDLKSGAVVVITETDIRVRTLPIPPGPRAD